LIEERLDDFALRALHIITERVGPRELVTADPFHPSARATDRDAGISVRCCVEREPERDVFSLQYLGVSAC
jgi:hypothetical protein